MRVLKLLLQKEFRQIFRNRTILLVIFIVPVLQLTLLPWAADYEVRNIKLAVIDHDHSDYSRRLISKVIASGFFQLDKYEYSYNNAFREIEKDKADIIIEIPAHFEKDLVRESEATILLSVNAINGVKAILGSSYLENIIRDLNNEIRMEWIQMPRFKPETDIDIRSSNRFNLLMNYKSFMVPGVLVMLITIIGSFLTSLNIVREKEIGSIEQINVSPLKKYQFILGKLIPFWILGLFILTIGLIIAWLLYRIVPAGSLLAIYLFSGVYLFAVLGFGLLISAISTTQQQAMLLTFFLFMIFILLGGLYTPVESMPAWARWFTKFNPIAYFIEVMRLVMMKGAGLSDIAPFMGIVFLFGLILNAWALLIYRKRAA
ncbi:MAG: ABC transporter permease [Bacteroidota bacterium]|nr:ABC transporter permease [Bacteroidota bacterium]